MTYLVNVYTLRVVVSYYRLIDSYHYTYIQPTCTFKHSGTV